LKPTLLARSAVGVQRVAVSVVIGIRQRNGDLRLIRAKDAKSATVKEIINANVGATWK